MISGHGPNIGHGFVKYLIIDEHGTELPPVVFPALVARASKQVIGAIEKVATVEAAGQSWWVGQDALLSPTPLTLLAQDRISDPVVIPALVKSAMQRMGYLNGAQVGYCVTGLPASWAVDREKAQALGARLREAYPFYQRIKVIPEPLALIYAVLLDNFGEIMGDEVLQSGRIGVIDLGHHTIDVAIIQRLVPEPTSLDTYELGTARPLKQIRSGLSARFERELTLFETDIAVRTGVVRIANQEQALPMGWDRPLIENGNVIASRLVESWGKGAQLERILIGGGGAELEIITKAIQKRFPHAEVVPNGQLAIARGYARLARRLGKEQA